MFGLFAKKDKGGPHYASFERRLLASIIDTLLLTLMIVPVIKYIWNPALEMQMVIRQMMMDYQSGNLSGEQFNHAFLEYMLLGGGGLIYLKDMGFQLTVFGIVIVLFWIYRQGTPGKLMLRMEIVDAKTLQVPTRWQCILRYLGYFVAVLPGMLGFFWVLFSKKRQGWHDLIAGTVVVVRPRRKKESDGAAS